MLVLGWGGLIQLASESFALVFMGCRLRAIRASGDWWGWVHSDSFGPVGEVPYVACGCLFKCFGCPVPFLEFAESFEEVTAFVDVGLYVWVEFASGFLIGLMKASSIGDAFGCV